MGLHLTLRPHRLRFKEEARTSRGSYNVHDVWYVRMTADELPGREGLGECAPLPDLSCDALPGQYETVLRRECQTIETTGHIDAERLRPYPSMLFGLETAWLHLQAGSPRLFDTAFSRGEAGIVINGLVWMGDFTTMMQRLEAKLHAGFRCVKLKIGAIGFDDELELIRHIRRRFSATDVELRLDANGAFRPDEALGKLDQLAPYAIHSIEQPIRAGQPDAMARVCRESPIDIALDEELIGVHKPEAKRALLETVRPHYIIIKPSLHGALSGADEWANEAQRLGIGHWMTSALESNVGLNAIAQWTAHHFCDAIPLPQGLGTGLLYENNIPSPLQIIGDRLWYKT